MAPDNPLVRLRGVAARAGTSTILRDVDMDVMHGEAIGLFGANGAGKTTLLRLLATLRKPSGGEATVLGADLGGSARYEVRPLIGLIGHVPSLYPELTLRENLHFVAAVLGAAADAVETVLADVGLSGAADRRAGDCSYGMQRRAEFGRELLRKPTLLLLDEPHSALDAAAVGIVAHSVASVRDRGGAAVLVSHDRERVEQLADRTVELVDGTLR